MQQKLTTRFFQTYKTKKKCQSDSNWDIYEYEDIFHNDLKFQILDKISF